MPWPVACGAAHSRATTLDALPDHLGGDEEPRAIAGASRGWKSGVLAVTTRRLLFLYVGGVVIDLRLEEIREAAPQSSSTDSLVVRGGGEMLTFSEIKGATAQEMTDAIYGARRV